MNLSDNDRVELTDLCNALADGKLTEPQQVRLNQMLTRSEEARQFYVRFVNLSASLREYATESQTCAVATERKSTSSFTTPWNWKSWLQSHWAWGTGALVAVVITVMWVHDSLGRRSGTNLEIPVASQTITVNNSVAVLGNCAEAQWQSPTTAPQPGQELSPGWLQLKSGAVQIEFYSGARVIVEGPAEFELVSAMSMRLRQGNARTVAPESARGFCVQGPGVVIMDLGTEFGLSVPTDNPPEVHVFRGKVEVTRRGESTGREVGEGKALRLGVKQVDTIPLRSASFLSELELAQRELAFALNRLVGWQKVCAALCQDPATLLHYTFDGQQSWERTLKNQSVATRTGTDGNIIGARWASGRWPGKGALEFRGQGDRVLLAPRVTRSNVTLMAWVRVDALTQTNSALLVSEEPLRWQFYNPQQLRSKASKPSSRIGEFRWELLQDGTISFNIVRSQSGKSLLWDTTRTPPILTPEWLGQWVQLAVTYEVGSGEVTHYFNGRMAARITSKNALPLSLELLELGNLSLGPTEVSQGMRYAFLGAMDEVLILDRILSTDEILALHEVGQARLGNFPLALNKSP